MSTSGWSHKQQASSRPHFQAVRKVFWKTVKNRVRNHSRPDEIDTKTENLHLSKIRILFPVSLTTEYKVNAD